MTSDLSVDGCYCYPYATKLIDSIEIIMMLKESNFVEKTKKKKPINDRSYM